MNDLVDFMASASWAYAAGLGIPELTIFCIRLGRLEVRPAPSPLKSGGPPFLLDANSLLIRGCCPAEKPE